MYLQLGEDPLGVVAGSVSADLELAGNRLVGAALGEELGHFDLPPGQRETLLQEPMTYLAVTWPKGKIGMLFLKPVPQLPELFNRAANLVHQYLIATAEA